VEEKVKYFTKFRLLFLVLKLSYHQGFSLSIPKDHNFILLSKEYQNPDLEFVS
jgi:hypothetical protein